MKKIFDLNNPVWQFIGNLADFFALSVLWYMCALLVVPFGAGSTAVYSVAMKMAYHTEGYTIKGFFDAFIKNFKQGTIIGLLYTGCGLILTMDFMWIFFGQPKIGIKVLPFAIVVALLFILCANMTFPVLAHYDNDTKSILKLGASIAFSNFIPVFSYTLLTLGLFTVGVFLFWPILLVAPGLSAYISAFILKHIFMKYDMSGDSF